MTNYSHFWLAPSGLCDLDLSQDSPTAHQIPEQRPPQSSATAAKTAPNRVADTVHWSATCVRVQVCTPPVRQQGRRVPSGVRTAASRRETRCSASSHGLLRRRARRAQPGMRTGGAGHTAKSPPFVAVASPAAHSAGTLRSTSSSMRLYGSAPSSRSLKA